MAKRLLFIVLVVCCTTLAFAGCKKGVPVQNQSSPIPLQQQVSDKKIAEAIMRAGARTNWEIYPAGHRTMTATLYSRAHTAMVTITYDDSNYYIRYKNSTNLKYKDGYIHPNYNKWVSTLDRNIRRELAALSLQGATP